MPSHANGLMLVVSGPSGVGKTSVVREVEARFDGRFSVSATTRSSTPEEVDGKDYFFLTREAFDRKREDGEFLECAQLFGDHWYGTPRAPAVEVLDAGGLLIMDIDVQGALQVRKSMPQALMVFILPPSDEELLRRLRGRGREGEDVIQRRFQEARREIDLARSSDVYDYMILNDDLDRAVQEMCKLVGSRLHAV